MICPIYLRGHSEWNEKGLNVMNQSLKRATKWYGAAFVIGLILAGLSSLLPAFSQGATRLHYLGLLVTLIVIVLAGRFARQTARRPSWFGMRIAWAVAVPIALGQLLTMPSEAVILKHLNQTSPTLSSALKHQIATMAHGPAGILEGLVGTLGTYFLMGVALGWIGAFFGSNRRADRQGV